MDGTAEIEALSDRLTQALRAVIRGSPLDGLGPIEVARALDIDKSLASRLMTALRARDPLEALIALPGPGPMRRFVDAARRHGASPRAADAAARLVGDFDRTLERTFGTRTHLDAALSDAQPEARRRHQDAARQSVYRGMALLKGVSIDLTSTTWVVHPGRGDRVDTQVVASFIGIRRFRATARVQFASQHVRSPRAPAALLEEFSTPRDLSVTSHRAGRTTVYEVPSLPIGRNAAADIHLAEFIPGGAERRAARGTRPRVAYGDAVAHPCKRQYLTVLVQRDVWPECAFSARVYDTTVRGMVAPGDASREADRLPIDVRVEFTPAAADALRSSPVPHHPELLRSVLAPLGWDLDEFRMFSCEIVYPVYGAEVMLVLEP